MDANADDEIDMLTEREILARIEAFLSKHGMPHTRFGRQAIGEASFVKTLREGRELKLGMARRLLVFMREFETGADHHGADTTGTVTAASGKSAGSTAQVAA